MRIPRLVMTLGAGLLVSVCAATGAQAAPAVGQESSDGVLITAYAARVMDVAPGQAAADLALQHNAFHYLQSLQRAGDTAWYDNKDATMHVYGPPSGSPPPAAIAADVKFDAEPYKQTPYAGITAPVSCGTSAYEYCTPVEGGARVSESGVGDCTAGPIVEDYSHVDEYMITAGHCDISGDTVLHQPFTSLLWPSLYSCAVGNATVTVDAPWTGYDIAVEPASTGTCGGMAPYIHDWQFGTDIPQQGAVTAAVGEVVCHRGITSLYACGTVIAAGVPTTIGPYSDGHDYSIQNTDQICMYGAPGDSGGTVSDATYPGAITGTMLSAGPDPYCGGTDTISIEQQIFTILNLHGVYVVGG
jgi:hypothetical protein